MRVSRTPDERFAAFEGYAFAPHYTEGKEDDGTPIRIHHVEEGPRDAAPILLMHGNPTFGAEDPVTRGGEKRLQEHIPGASGQPHHVFPEASHFIQEDVPGELVARILDFIEGTPS